MKKVTLFIFLLFTVSCFSAFAQKDKDALEVLKKVEKRGLAHKSILTSVDYKLENPEEKNNETLNGKLLMKGNKFKFTIDQTETYCDGKTKWVYLIESDEVNVSNVVQADDLDPEEQFINNPLSIFSFYKKDFKYVLKGKEKIDTKNSTVIDLTPENLKKPYFKIRLWILDNYDIYAIKYFQKDGIRINLFFKDFKTNIKAENSDFIFDKKKYPNVEIIDLR